MSRRFGRNQKRQMRAALAAEQQRVQSLDMSNQMFRQTTREIQAQLDHISEFYNELMRRLPRNSLFAPLEKCDVVRADYPYINIQRHDMDFSAFTPSDAPMANMHVQVERIPLVHLEVLIERNMNALSYDLWFLAKSGESDLNRQYCLCISRDAMVRPTRELKHTLMQMMEHRLDEFFNAGDVPRRA